MQSETVLLDLLLREELTSQHFKLLSIDQLHYVIDSVLVLPRRVYLFDRVNDLTVLYEAHLLRLPEHLGQYSSAHLLHESLLLLFLATLFLFCCFLGPLALFRTESLGHHIKLGAFWLLAALS